MIQLILALKLKILVYNGDADGVCNFLGGNLSIPPIKPTHNLTHCLDEWFVEDLVAPKKLNLPTVSARQQWYYQKSEEFVPAPVGFYKTYGTNDFLIDLVCFLCYSSLMFYYFCIGNNRWSWPLCADL